MKFTSRSSDSISDSTFIVFTLTVSETRFLVFEPNLFWDVKYDDTLFLRFFAFPMYITSPLSFSKKYTPGCEDND